MRLLLDENVHRTVVTRLREAGFELEWISETSPGALDPEILARSDIAQFILITNDGDFGDLIFNHGLPAPKTILYTRLPHRAAEQTVTCLIALLEAGVPAGQMITLTKNGERTKPFPSGAHHG
ncbi:DUF5615 family PIN-like protein [Sphingomonas sp. PAMC 26621]|uniref:DUF5615 family PIN-like protein n=1 Tax=Sphingomonas sp. PAMC 26621 TaxID=1112213 RepID=UPI00028983FD|nr:DUF5615 family PIN-like protein [Sphingomonas sp. PAMC 26621]